MRFLWALTLTFCACTSVPPEASVDTSATLPRPPPLPQRTLMLGGVDFRGSYGFGKLMQAYQAESTWNYARIPLPVGAAVSTVTIRYWVGYGAVRPHLEMLDAGGLVSTLESGTWDTVSDNTMHSQTLSLGATLDDDHVYWILVETPHVSSGIYQARISYTDPP